MQICWFILSQNETFSFQLGKYFPSIIIVNRNINSCLSITWALYLTNSDTNQFISNLELQEEFDKN